MTSYDYSPRSPHSSHANITANMTPRSTVSRNIHPTQESNANYCNSPIQSTDHPFLPGYNNLAQLEYPSPISLEGPTSHMHLQPQSPHSISMSTFQFPTAPTDQITQHSRLSQRKATPHPYPPASHLRSFPSAQSNADTCSTSNGLYNAYSQPGILISPTPIREYGLNSSKSFIPLLPPPSKRNPQLRSSASTYSLRSSRETGYNASPASFAPSFESGAHSTSNSSPSLRLSSSTSHLRKKKDHYYRSRQLSTISRSQCPSSPPPPVPALPTGFSESTSPQPQASTRSFSSGSVNGYSTAQHSAGGCPRRMIKRLERPDSLSPGKGYNRSSVYFNLNGSSGIRVKDILQRGAIVDSANDPAFPTHRWSTTRFAIHWPGYPESSHYTKLQAIDARGSRITKQDLAKLIANSIYIFMEPLLNRSIPINISDPNYMWRISKKDGHSVGDVILMSLHLYKDVWVPELSVFF